MPVLECDSMTHFETKALVSGIGQNADPLTRMRSVLTLLVLLAASLYFTVFIFAMRREMRAFYMRARVAYSRESSRRN
jgi:hypothetical protein